MMLHEHVAPASMVYLSHVNKSLGGAKRTDDVCIQAEKGKIYGLIGPNGAGKTTLLNLITGLYEADSGTIRIDGFDPIKDYKETRRRIGLLPQDTALYPELSARENLAFHAALYLTELSHVRQRIEEILTLVDLNGRGDDPVKHFSGGMSRRLGIGRALLNDPAILLLDEPTLGVDVQGTHKIWTYIRNLKNHDKTIFVTTNIMNEADALCDEVMILDHGRIVCQGAPEDLKADLGAATIYLTPAQPDAIPETVIRERIGDYTTDDANTIIVKAPQGEADLAQVLDALKDVLAFERVSLHKPSLDDVFLAHTGKDLRD